MHSIAPGTHATRYTSYRAATALLLQVGASVRGSTAVKRSGSDAKWSVSRARPSSYGVRVRWSQHALAACTPSPSRAGQTAPRRITKRGASHAMHCAAPCGEKSGWGTGGESP